MVVIVVIVIVLDVVMIAASVVLEGVVTSEITQLQALLSWISPPQDPSGKVRSK